MKTKTIEDLQRELADIELRKLKLHVKTERAKLRKLEAAARAERTGAPNLDELRKAITTGPLKNGRGASSTKLRESSHAWRKLLAMLRQPAESQPRLVAEGVLRRLHVIYDDGVADTGKGNARMFFYESGTITPSGADVL